ncbi:MAG: histidine kinase dimerization/phospho-acceptor domain-containing protein, partial [Anaerolineales bacterium]
MVLKVFDGAQIDTPTQSHLFRIVIQGQHMAEKSAPEINDLIEKYAQGRMPPLVDIDVPARGLVNPQWLKIYRIGFIANYATALDILLPEPTNSIPRKWDKGNFIASEYWAAPSANIESQLLERAWGDLGRQYAAIAEEQKTVIAYLDGDGLINFAAPVIVDNQVVATLFSGWFKPNTDFLWDANILSTNGYFKPLKPGEAGVSLAGVKGDDEIDLGQHSSEIKKISPQEVEAFLKALSETTQSLSDLATSVYEVEKDKIFQWMENQLPSVLSPLRDRPENIDEVWKGLSQNLAGITKYFGFDYALIVSLHDTNEKNIRILCQIGLPETDFPIGPKMPLSSESYRSLKSVFDGVNGLVSLKPADFEYLPVFKNLYAKGKNKSVLATSVSPRGKALASLVIIGKFKKDVALEWRSGKDLQTLKHIADGIGLVLEITLLIEQLEVTAKTQAHFLEDVAHDIRTPIQNLILQSEAFNLTLTPEDARSIGQKMAAQARRLNRMSVRVWTIVKLDQGALVSEKPGWVPVYQIIMEHRKFLLDVAEKKDIQITVDKDIEGWQPIQVHKSLFSQAVLNLIDNAIK